MKICLFIMIFYFIFSSAHAQIIGISPVKIFTNNYEIQNPMGFGVSISKTIGIFEVQGEYVFAKNERTYTGYLSYGFMAPPPPPLEIIKSTSSFSAFELGLSVVLLDRRSDFNINLGLGYSFDSYSADRIGWTSGEKATFDAGEKSGPFMFFAIDYFLLNGLSLGLDYRIKDLSRGNMATDVELPFVNIKTVRELQLGLSYHLK